VSITVHDLVSNESVEYVDAEETIMIAMIPEDIWMNWTRTQRRPGGNRNSTPDDPFLNTPGKIVCASSMPLDIELFYLMDTTHHSSVTHQVKEWNEVVDGTSTSSKVHEARYSGKNPVYKSESQGTEHNSWASINVPRTVNMVTKFALDLHLAIQREQKEIGVRLHSHEKKSI
jgi:hypothetical protein